MTAQIVMTHDYPKVAPVFVVSVLWQHERTAANDKHIKVRTCTKKSSLLQYYKLERLLIIIITLFSAITGNGGGGECSP